MKESAKFSKSNCRFLTASLLRASCRPTGFYIGSPRNPALVSYSGFLEQYTNSSDTMRFAQLIGALTHSREHGGNNNRLVFLIIFLRMSDYSSVIC